MPSEIRLSQDEYVMCNLSTLNEDDIISPIAIITRCSNLQIIGINEKNEQITFMGHAPFGATNGSKITGEIQDFINNWIIPENIKQLKIRDIVLETYIDARIEEPDRVSPLKEKMANLIQDGSIEGYIFESMSSKDPNQIQFRKNATVATREIFQPTLIDQIPVEKVGIYNEIENLTIITADKAKSKPSETPFLTEQSKNNRGCLSSILSIFQ